MAVVLPTGAAPKVPCKRRCPPKVLRDNATADPALLEVSLAMPGIPIQRRV